MTQHHLSDKTNMFDVAIIGGAMMGLAAAWFLSHHPEFDGRILVIERDPTYSFCSTSHTHSCVRQQYANALNIKIAQFAVEMLRNFKHHMKDPAAPDIALDSFGYMYLAQSDGFAKQSQRHQ